MYVIPGLRNIAMNSAEFWKNFGLGEELSIAGAFIYNGLRRFHELRKLDFADEIFEVFYNISVGLERLLKIAVVLLEHTESTDQEALEKSLITHNHLDLLLRVRRCTPVRLDSPHHELLALLSAFYKSTRYGRFSISSNKDLKGEQVALRGFLAKHLRVEFEGGDTGLGTFNTERYQKFLLKTVRKISTEIYRVVETRARELNLYTYEVRHGTKAETIFRGDADIPGEEVIWKELLVFFMNTKASSGYLEFLRSIPPLDFDPALVDEYLDCFQSDTAKALVRDELEHHYEQLEDAGDRLKLIGVIGSVGVHFSEPEDNDLDQFSKLDDPSL